MTKDEVIASMAIVAINKDDTLYFSLLSTKAAMDIYAKQTSIAFVKWAIESGKIIGDNWGDAFISSPETEETIYNQFIEQQTKQ